MRRQHRKLDQGCGAGTGVGQQMRDGLGRIVLVGYAVFVVVVRETFPVHLGMLSLKSFVVTEHNRLPGRCEGLAEER